MNQAAASRSTPLGLMSELGVPGGNSTHRLWPARQEAAGQAGVRCRELQGCQSHVRVVQHVEALPCEPGNVGSWSAHHTSRPTNHNLAPCSSAFHADVASGSMCMLVPLRAGPHTNQR